MKKWMLGIVVILMLSVEPLSVHAMEEAVTEDAAADETMEGYLEELDFSEVDTMLQENGTGIRFKELVQRLIDGEEIDKGELLKEIFSVVFREVSAFRTELLQIVMLCIVFAILYNFTNIFENPAVTQISFYMVYILLLVMLLKSFFILKDIVAVGLENVLMFLKLLIPTFSLSMIFSGNITTGSGFYELTFILIYLIEWLLSVLIVPGIQIYVVLEMTNYLTEEEMLSKMTELIK